MDVNVQSNDLYNDNRFNGPLPLCSIQPRTESADPPVVFLIVADDP